MNYDRYVYGTFWRDFWKRGVRPVLWVMLWVMFIILAVSTNFFSLADGVYD